MWKVTLAHMMENKRWRLYIAHLFGDKYWKMYLNMFYNVILMTKKHWELVEYKD